MNYYEKIASLFLGEKQNKPILILKADQIPLNHPLDLSLALFMIELDKPYQLKTEVIDGNGNLILSSLTPEFSSKNLDASKFEVLEEKYFSSTFSLTTPIVHFTSSGAYRIKVTLLSGEESLDYTNVYFYIDKR
ncbi:hypothetical protein LOB39_02475 [Lactobacillus delbrueckii subsp. sunkii]|uniref:Uncharacterized protein n=1 Tax=Lactobacillus delbrueckii subsp. allosunkii TaxID=1050107 RepID=A0ABD4S9H9_9LACO|nr:hypothetical protein [Lactobacillus delbrueckii]MCD5517441.1 hypothetical protein [Lactobacillus delbrueckii subsp. sunkii]